MANGIYTPFLADSVQNIQNNLARRNIRNIAQSAYLGNENSMGKLQGISPEIANNISQQQNLKKQQQQKEQMIQQEALKNILDEAIFIEDNDKAIEYAIYEAERQGLGNIDHSKLTPDLLDTYREQRKNQNQNQKNSTSTGIKGVEGDMLLRDEKGNIFSQQTYLDQPNKKSYSVLTDVSGKQTEPMGRLTPINKMGSSEFDISQQKVKTATDIEQAKTDIEIKMTEELEDAKRKAAQKTKKLEKISNYKDINPSLDTLEELVKKGIYTGNLIDKGSKVFSKVGIVLDQDKLNRTAQARQIATSLKILQRPPGMGNTTEGEWKMLQETIPNPDSSTNEEILAGIKEFKRRLEDTVKQDIPIITNQQQYEELESGIYFKDGDNGQIYRKP